MMEVVWQMTLYQKTVVVEFCEDIVCNKRECSNYSAVQLLKDTYPDLNPLTSFIDNWLNYKEEVSNKKLVYVIKPKITKYLYSLNLRFGIIKPHYYSAIEAIPVDGNELKEKGYYFALSVDDRFREILDLTYTSLKEKANALQIKGPRISDKGGKIASRILFLNKLLHRCDGNIFYVVENMSKFKYEGYVNLHINFGNLLRTYNSSTYKYALPNSLSSIICQLKKGNRDISLSVLYQFSQVYKKPIWWLIQDDADIVVDPTIRKLSHNFDERNSNVSSSS